MVPLGRLRVGGNVKFMSSIYFPVNCVPILFPLLFSIIRLFLAAIAALYVTMSVGRMVGWSDGRSVCNEFQS